MNKNDTQPPEECPTWGVFGRALYGRNRSQEASGLYCEESVLWTGLREQAEAKARRLNRIMRRANVDDVEYSAVPIPDVEKTIKEIAEKRAREKAEYRERLRKNRAARAAERGEPPPREQRNDFAEQLPIPLGDDEVQVQSESEQGKGYRVKFTEKGVWCSCPSFRFQGGPISGRICKHIKAVVEGRA